MLKGAVRGLAILAVLSCSALVAAQTVVRDDTRRATTFQSPPQRIVSLLPAITEMVCELGACERLVGVDRHSNHPASVLALTRLGGMEDTPLETLLALRPDLVLVAGSTRMLPRLQSLGLRVMVFEPRDQHDADRMGRSLSLVLTGGLLAWENLAARQQTIWREMSAKLDARWRHARVYVEVGEGPYVAAQHSFIGDALQQVGLRSAVPGSWGVFPRLSPEWVLRAQPDWIVLSSTATPVQRRPGWQSLTAANADHVCILNPQEMDALVRPGPRLHEGIQAILQCMRAKSS